LWNLRLTNGHEFSSVCASQCFEEGCRKQRARRGNYSFFRDVCYGILIFGATVGHIKPAMPMSCKDNNKKGSFPDAVMPVFFLTHVVDEKVPSNAG